MRILIVDDDAATLLTLQRAAIAAGHECDVAATLPDALAMIAANAYDAVAADWVLTGGDGAAAARAAAAAGMRAVLMSGARPPLLEDERALLEAEGLRGVAVLQKPLGSSGELLAALAASPAPEG